MSTENKPETGNKVETKKKKKNILGTAFNAVAGVSGVVALFSILSKAAVKIGGSNRG